MALSCFGADAAMRQRRSNDGGRWSRFSECGRSREQPSHIRGTLLAFCDMKTLYLRNVPDDVTERLAVMAAREGMSVSSFALRELGHAARRADNPAVLGDLPDLDVAANAVVADVEAGRSGR